MITTYITPTSCRICGGTKFESVVDLGMMPYADAFVKPTDPAQRDYPLEAIGCLTCGLVQLTVIAPREELYPDDYPYVSSTTKTGVAHYHEMARELVSELGIRYGLAVDVGSNVGVLLDGFRRVGMRVLGVEPVKPIAEEAVARQIPTVNAFFSETLARELCMTHGRAKLITGTNVIAHIDDLHDLMRGIDALLDKDGTFVFEAPYLRDMLEELEYDTIYHEHLSYLAIRPVQRLCEQFGMTIVNVKHFQIHGGTLRYYIKRNGLMSAGATLLLNQELETCSPTAWRIFGNAVTEHRAEFHALIRGLRQAGKTIVGVSAPAKGMTLLHACALTRHDIAYITEKAPLKIGKLTPGLRIPVVPDEWLLQDQPDFAVLLAWNFAGEIMENLKAYTDAGGRFIVPLPSPRIFKSNVLEQAG